MYTSGKQYHHLNSSQEHIAVIPLKLFTQLYMMSLDEEFCS